MKRLKNNFIFFLLMLAVSLLVITANAQDAKLSKQEKPDKIRIVNFTSAAPVIDGTKNEFTVEIEYTLEPMDAGSVAIGFNITNSRSFRMTTRKKVKKGTNFITLKAKITPKDWNKNGDFTILANLSPDPLPRTRYTPMAATETIINFT
jgi:hypothetical protein